ncbi:MAG: hypothetical protein IIT88_03115 [Acetobacter sp.]|nr:hypothetical protein [Acetobacter sp.]
MNENTQQDLPSENDPKTICHAEMDVQTSRFARHFSDIQRKFWQIFYVKKIP